MADGFLGRWSRRKAGLEPEGLDGSAPELKPKTTPSSVPQDKKTIESASTPAEEETLPPTLEDAESIDRFAPDFSAFMKPNVDPAVQHAAMKKLFSDPHFNIMDRLDIYIDDYSKFTPLSQEDIGKMTLSKQLLSRPDLELPKIGDIKEGLNALPGSVDELPEVPTPVLDKQENEAQTGEENTQTEGDPRVIPNESQTIDSQEQLTERSFENLPKK